MVLVANMAYMGGRERTNESQPVGHTSFIHATVDTPRESPLIVPIGFKKMVKQQTNCSVTCTTWLDLVSLVVEEIFASVLVVNAAYLTRRERKKRRVCGRALIG